MYMSNTVGIAELRQNLSKYLRRVEAGERLVVTDRNKPVAELGPAPTPGRALDRLIAEGKVRPPKSRGGFGRPLEMGSDPEAATRALEEVRGYR
jgi:prevent-host-death family protein